MYNKCLFAVVLCLLICESITFDENQDQLMPLTTITVDKPALKIDANGTDNNVSYSKGLNETYAQDLLNIYHKQIDDFKTWIKNPYVHGLILPAVIGVCASLSTVCILCTVQTCVKSTVRRRRKRRIKNLSEDLKSDKSSRHGLLAEDSEDEI